ncbi:MAG: cytochrome c [Gemmataceae bacterium]|nr:cytochrome c [Gemmataceae bacterium]
MKKLLALALCLGLAGLYVQAEEDKKEDKKGKKAHSIKEVMEAHGETGVRATVQEAIKEKDWEGASKAAKLWVALAEDLGKNKPRRGSKESWEKLSGTYEKTVKTVAEAVGEKNAARANGAIGKIGTTCKACHDAHKGKGKK